jgi:hypothetical protein
LKSPDLYRLQESLAGDVFRDRYLAKPKGLDKYGNDLAVLRPE